MKKIYLWSWSKSVLSAVALVIVASVQMSAQRSPLWGSLEAGKYTVGFRVIYKYDHSRSWQPAHGEPGGTAGRPVRISVWYPASATSGAKRVLFGDYVSYQADDAGFRQANKMLEERDAASFQRFLKNPKQAFKQLSAVAMEAFRDAPPVNEKFPLVIYSSGLNDISASNVVLFEYLASHGYVVATVPQLGTSPVSVNLGVNPIDLETQTRDVEFALAAVQDFPAVDNRKLAVAGHSMGGVSALILQMRNSRVDAMIGLDSSYGVRPLTRTLTESPYYQPEKMQTPFLDMRVPRAETDLSAVDAFRYSDRYFFTFPGIFHGDFTNFPLIALRFPTDIQDRTPEVAARGYEAVCRYTLNFLNAYLKRDPAGLTFMRNQPQANGIPENVAKGQFKKGLQPPPTEEEFAKIAAAEGLQKALDVYRKFKAHEPQQSIIREGVLNTLGYSLLGSGQVNESINLFRLNIEAHPTSANAYDSLADAYLRNGNTAEAIKQYEKVLELLPSDNTLNQEQKNSLRHTAMEQLKRLRP